MNRWRKSGMTAHIHILPMFALNLVFALNGIILYIDESRLRQYVLILSFCVGHGHMLQ